MHFLHVIYIIATFRATIIWYIDIDEMMRGSNYELILNYNFLHQ